MAITTVDNPNTMTPRLRQDWFRRMSEKRSSLRWAGIAALAAGMLAIFFPFAASLSVNAIVAAVLLMTGGVMIWTAFALSGWALAAQLIAGIFSVLAGLVAIVFPLLGILWLSVMLLVFILFEGISQIWFALKMKPEGHWGWLIASGTVSVILAAVLFIYLPAFTPVLIGLFLGINLVTTGIALMMLSSRLTPDNLAKAFPDPRAESDAVETKTREKPENDPSKDAVPISPNLN